MSGGWGPSDVDGSWVGAWTAALDGLELDVARAEALLARDEPAVESAWAAAAATTGWTPPELPGPLPAQLRRRAESILTRQIGVSHELTRAMADSRRHRRLAERLEPGPDARVPVFLDSRS